MTRKMGLYIQRSNGDGLREMCERIKPAVVLVHLDGGDLFGWLKANLPGTFVIGRRYWTEAEQEQLLASGITGQGLAELVLGVPGAQYCDAYMLFNEAMGSPVDHGGEPEFQRRAARLDRLQVEFRAALVAQGKEAVAFNFGAGNWPTWEHYKEHFPLTVAAYRYFGFHVYGWPKLVGAGWHSNFDETLRIIDGLGPEKTAIITEVAVTRAYANPGPDEGWLSQGDGAPLSLDAYAGDLLAVGETLNGRAHILGACLFNAAPDARWRTFAVTPELVERLAGFPEGTAEDAKKKIELRLPFAGTYRLTQGWGERPEVYAKFGLKGHEGVDWALPLGTPVLACADGVVDLVDEIAGDATKDPYGICVRIKHDGFTTWYAHLSKATVKKSRKVKAGEEIGLSGATGNSTGPHLHLSFRLDGADVKDGYLGRSDPMPCMEETTVVPPPDNAAQAKALLVQAAALLKQAQELLV